jgi:hypothetical protein
MKTDVQGKPVLMLGRIDDQHCERVGTASTTCRECGHECSIAPASIERLRIQPEIVVLCIECAMASHAARPFASFAPVSVRELIEAIRERAKRCG